MQKKNFKTTRDASRTKKIDIQIFSLLQTIFDARK